MEYTAPSDPSLRGPIIVGSIALNVYLWLCALVTFGVL